MIKSQLEKARKTIGGRFESVAENVGPRVRHVEQEGKQFKDDVSRAVAKQPLMALAVAFVVGLSLGVAIGGAASRN
jgi:ElaB/YqjD/DUF883 family membrane-anchored ribosome-binding protein